MDIKIGDRLAEVTLLSKDGNKVSIDVDGKVYNIDVCMFTSGQCSILHKGTSYNPFVVHESGSKHYSVSLNYSVYEIDMLDSEAKYMRMRRKSSLDRPNDKITAPMPSKVIRLLVEPGQKVSKGETLIVLEAMKMQSGIEASRDCVVESVNCSEGDSVMADQVLISLKFEDESASE
ncbi:MAG: acetyl-CoA carboxylase biotin carboxyl carrier protein subunit [Bacteroidales bacterium]|nr:acetyl-CoA carboxylase biotin carboxyl carrier protein subunit [Bacteroidales bacterium]